MANHEASAGLPSDFYLLPDEANDVVLQNRALALRKAGSVGMEIDPPGRAIQEANQQLLQAYGQLLPPRGALPPYDATECCRPGKPPRVKAPVHVWSKRARFTMNRSTPARPRLILNKLLTSFETAPEMKQAAVSATFWVHPWSRRRAGGGSHW